MQNGWDTDKNKGNPYLELPLYLIIYIELSQVLHHTP